MITSRTLEPATARTICLSPLTRRLSLRRVKSARISKIHVSERIGTVGSKAQFVRFTPDNLENTFRSRNECMSGQNPAVLKIVNREFLILLRINGMCYSLARLRSFLIFAGCSTFVGFSLALATLTAPEFSSSNRRCSISAANSQNTRELKTEEWVRG